MHSQAETDTVRCQANSYIRFDGHTSKSSTGIMSTSFELHGFHLSTGTNRVALIAKERNIPYTPVTVDLMKEEQKQASYLEHHPFGQVPRVVVRVLFKPPLPPSPFPDALSSLTMVSSCTSRAPSVATSPRSDLAPPWCRPNPARSPNSSRRRASSMGSLALLPI
jgi:hypothetical protein